MLRRAFALLAMSVVGFATAALVASPATAQVNPPINFIENELSEVDFQNTCEGTKVSFTSGSFQDVYEWNVEVNGVSFGEFDSPAPGETANVFVPNFGAAGEIEVSFNNAPAPSWPQYHTWSEPHGVDCDGILEVELTQPTCDNELGSILIPSPPADLPQFIPPYVYKLNGEDVERGSTQEVEVGTHLIEVYQPAFGPWSEKLLRDWEYEVVAAEDCPTPTPTTSTSPTPTPSPTTTATGTGGGSDDGQSLPMTGSPVNTLGLAGAALLLGGSTAVGLSIAWKRRSNKDAVDNLVAESTE